jgi:hypothetical protein
VAIDEQRLRIRRSLEEKLGVEEASYLMDRPVGGWSELVTNHTLDLKFDVVEERFRALDERFAMIDERFAMIDRRFDLLDERFEALEHRVDSSIAALRHEMIGEIDRRLGEIDRRIGNLAWRIVTAVIAGMAVMATIFAGVTAGLVVLLGP